MVKQGSYKKMKIVRRNGKKTVPQWRNWRNWRGELQVNEQILTGESWEHGRRVDRKGNIGGKRWVGDRGGVILLIHRNEQGRILIIISNFHEFYTGNLLFELLWFLLLNYSVTSKWIENLQVLWFCDSVDLIYFYLSSQNEVKSWVLT